MARSGTNQIVSTSGLYTFGDISVMPVLRGNIQQVAEIGQRVTNVPLVNSNHQQANRRVGHVLQYTKLLKGHESCVSCPTGKYQGSTGQSSCDKCAIGKYQGSTGQSSCDKCPTGKYQGSTGKSWCASCAIGKYQGSTGKSSCDKCPTGQYQQSSGKSWCASCPTGQYQGLTG